jgi:dTDP-4-amino-4,6-dideoxygalactose transaminase
MTSVPFFDLRRQYETIRYELEPTVLDALSSTEYILGAEVQRFEGEWAAFCGTDHAVGVASGTAALGLAYQALGISDGDEVVVPANTFIATILPLVRRGARPVLVDCDEYGLIDVESAAAAVTRRTKAIVGVHLYGHPCDTDSLGALCDERGLVLVEDAAQAHGAERRGRRAGSLGRIAAFSFYPGKNLGAAGDAGAVTTDDEELATRIRMLRDLGQRRKYDHVLLGTNERLDTLQAAVLRVKLRRLEDWNELRRAHAERYSELLDGVVTTPRAPEGTVSAWHLYVVRTPLRDQLRDRLSEEQIGHGMHYPLPLHLQPVLAGLGYSEGDFPVAEEWARTLLSLPMFPELEPEEIERVAAAVRSVCASPEPVIGG